MMIPLYENYLKEVSDIIRRIEKLASERNTLLSITSQNSTIKMVQLAEVSDKLTKNLVEYYRKTSDEFMRRQSLLQKEKEIVYDKMLDYLDTRNKKGC